jgi:ADP-ribose pyrophosphatase
MGKKWIEHSRELVQKTFLFQLYRASFSTEDAQKRSHFDILVCSDWANIIPITRDGRVVLVRQFRFGTQEMTLEFPAGAVEPGEDPSQTASRELLEEVGGQGGSLIRLGSCRPNPGFLSNSCFHFLAKDIELNGTQNLDPLESITFESYSVN